jgi:hypothetical protein
MTKQNKVYDTGNYLEKKYAEVIYFSKEIDIRANWDVEQIFDLSIPYTPEPKINWTRRSNTILVLLNYYNAP